MNIFSINYHKAREATLFFMYFYDYQYYMSQIMIRHLIHVEFRFGSDLQRDFMNVLQECELEFMTLVCVDKEKGFLSMVVELLVQSPGSNDPKNHLWFQFRPQFCYWSETVSQEVCSISILSQCLTLVSVMLLDPHLEKRSVRGPGVKHSAISVEFKSSILN